MVTWYVQVLLKAIPTRNMTDVLFCVTSVEALKVVNEVCVKFNRGFMRQKPDVSWCRSRERIWEDRRVNTLDFKHIFKDIQSMNFTWFTHMLNFLSVPVPHTGPEHQCLPPYEKHERLFWWLGRRLHCGWNGSLNETLNYTLYVCYPTLTFKKLTFFTYFVDYSGMNEALQYRMTQRHVMSLSYSCGKFFEWKDPVGPSRRNCPSHAVAIGQKTHLPSIYNFSQRTTSFFFICILGYICG